MLPYPSGPSLHMGHVLNYTMGDIQTHVRRRSGWHVARPMGWDAFGLPAENAAIREGKHPRVTIERNIANCRAQMKRLGWAIDWDREVSSHDPRFYRWTQWLFLKFWENDLAYRKEAPVNWCPKDQTVVANEYVVDGRCERCGTPVELRHMTQWFFRTTAYADELLEYEGADWPERTKTIQRNWIGRSEGAEILFRVDETGEDLPVFTTRADTLFGATFFVVAPEHPFVEAHASEEAKEYARHAGTRPVEERAAETKKTGVFTGLHAVNPINGERLPIWVADYVLMDYGTGAIMAVPAHDERDGEFAEAFGLPTKEVIDEDGRLVNSDGFDGLPSAEGARAIVAALEKEGRGRATVSYRLRDWSFSRQRYWGCPIPVIYCESCGAVPVPEDQLPVLLPEIEDYAPKGKAPLAGNEEWMRVDCPKCGGEAQRDPDTMDTFVDSSWYFLRYIDSHNDEAPFDRQVVDYWLPVDQYIGGIDHTTGHLLYSRFFVKAMNDWGMVGFREPFARVFHQGWVTLGGSKMSKTKGNVEGPDEMVDRYGADAVRLYILFMGPADQDMEWTPDGVEGIVRFLRRLWRVVHEVAEAAPSPGEREGALSRKANETIARVTRRRPAPLPVPHSDLGGDGARERARRRGRRARRAFRDRDGRVADPAVRAACRRGAVGSSRPRTAVGGAVAGGRRVAARARHVRARRAGEREGARPLRGRCEPERGGARRAGARQRAGAVLPRRWRAAQDDRRPSQARQLRDLALPRLRPVDVPVATDGCVPTQVVLVLPGRE